MIAFKLSGVLLLRMCSTKSHFEDNNPKQQ